MGRGQGHGYCGNSSSSAEDGGCRSEQAPLVCSVVGSVHSSVPVDRICESIDLPKSPEGPSIEFQGALLRNSHFAIRGADGILTPLNTDTIWSLGKPKTAAHDAINRETTPVKTQDFSSNRSSGTSHLQDTATSADMRHLVIVGDIKVFGLFPGTLEIYQNVDRQQPYSEIFRPETSSLSLRTFFPSMEQHLFSAIKLENVALGYLAYPVGDLDYTGVYLQTNVIFTGALKPISDVLHDYFGQQDPSLRLTTYFGAVRDWNSFPSVDQLTFRGSLENISAKLFDMLEFTRAGVELLMDADTDLSKRSTKWRFGYGFFGDVDLSIPGSDVPLKCSFYLRKLCNNYMLSLTLEDDEWIGIFGIQGLDLSCVYFEGMINARGESNHFELKVEAEMRWLTTSIAVGGSYGSTGFSIHAYVGDLSFRDIRDLFQQMMGVELGAFDHDIILKSIYLEVSSQGFYLAGSITINDHSSAAGRLELSRNGIRVSGSVEDIYFENIEIRNAKLDIFIGTKSNEQSTRETRVAIAGDVCFQGIELRAGLYIRNPGGSRPLERTLYGEVQGILRTARFCPTLEGTFLDISLANVALLVADHDNSSGLFTTHGYKAVKGIRFCATINSFPSLEDLVGGSINGTILTAAYSNSTFALSLTLPSKRTITFSQGVYTGPISLAIQIGTDIKLVADAKLIVERSNQSLPLEFALALQVGAKEASAYGHMLTDWVNPCGVGDRVIIRNCAVDIKIFYATFVATGMPEKLGIAGQISIGQKEATVAVILCQDPTEQLLKASITDMGITDLVKFASKIIELDLPLPDPDLLHFNKFDLYLSTGATVGATYYPPGASLKGDMVLLGKRATFDCRISCGVKIMATIEAFSVGPLKITGAEDVNPVVNIELSSSAQKIYIDGAVSIWGASAAIHLDATFQPIPRFELSFQLQLCDLLLVQFHAKLAQKIDMKDLKSLENAEFELHAKVEQSVIRKITKEVERRINSAQDALTKTLDSARATLTAKEQDFESACQNAERALESARMVWQRKQNSVKKALYRAKKDLEKRRQELQHEVNKAEAEWTRACAVAKQDLRDAQKRATAAIREAQAGVDQAQRDSDRDIRDAQRVLRQAKDDFNQKFWYAQKDVENARHDVEAVQKSLENLQNDINWKEKQWDAAGPIDCIPITAELAALHAAKLTAWIALETVQGVLLAAENVIERTGVIGSDVAIGAAQLTLDGVQEVKKSALIVAMAALKETEEIENAAVQIALEAVQKAETALKELNLFNVARIALDEACNIAQRVVDTAQEAVDALANCVEFVAFNIAKQAVAFARKNTRELNLARHAVDMAEGAAHLGLDIANWTINHLGNLLDIQNIEFDGSSNSLIGGGPHLRILIQGLLCGDRFQSEIEWQIDFDFAAFSTAVFNKLWERIKGPATMAAQRAASQDKKNDTIRSLEDKAPATPRVSSTTSNVVRVRATIPMSRSTRSPRPVKTSTPVATPRQVKYPGLKLGLVENARYKIVSAATGTVIDLSRADSASVFGYEWHGGKNQMWTFEPYRNNWRIRNVQTLRYLYPSGNANGSQVYSSSGSIEWGIYRDEGRKTYRIFLGRNRNHCCLDLAGSNAANSTPLLLYDGHDGANQEWCFIEVKS